MHGEQRRLAELGDVREHRHFDRGRELAVLVERRERFGEDHVGAGRDVALGALDRGGLPFDGVRVGARHDDEGIVAAAVDGGLDAIGHLVRADQRLAGTVTAALGLHLVFQVHAAGTGTAQLAGRAGDVESRAPTGVGVDEQRQLGRAGDAAHVFADVVETGDAEIGKSERGIRNAGTRQVQSAKPGTLRQQSAVGVDRADDLQGSLFCYGCPQPGASRNRHSLSVETSRGRRRIVNENGPDGTAVRPV